MPIASDDYVIEHFQFEQLATTDEIARHFDVCFAGGRLATRVVVHNHYGRRCRHDGDAEHFPRMHKQSIQRAVTDEVMASDSLARIQKQYRETLPLRIVVR